MALTKNDLSQVRELLIDTVNQLLTDIILPRFDAMDARFDAMENHMRTIEVDLRQLNSEVVTLRRKVEDMDTRLASVEGKVEALENDIKEIYDMMARVKQAPVADKPFLRLKLKDKILATYDLVLITAKEANVTLPRQN